MKKQKGPRQPACDYNREAGWVTLRLPMALGQKAKDTLINHLKKLFWEQGRFQWTNDADLRLIAKRGADFLENLTILLQWAEHAVRKIKHTATA